MMSLFFHFQHTLNRLFSNCIKLYWYQISPSWNMKGELTSKSPDLLGLKSWSIAAKYSQKRELNISAFKYSINVLFLSIRNAWCWFVIHGCLKNSIWLIFSYFSDSLLLYWKSKLNLLMLLSEAFSEFFTKVALRPALVILLTC